MYREPHRPGRANAPGPMTRHYVDGQNMARSETTKFLPGPLMPLANTR